MRQDLAGLYRPKLLDDLIGQETVTQTIRNSFKRGNLHHSYLLVGHYGSGKTSLGRILAAMENCEVTPGLNPCGKCKACSLIFSGKHTDVNEIDAASSAGKVEQIRQLKNDAAFNPIEVKMKYFIVDECHRVSHEAADALLKLIEEPPKHCRFILCTTDAQKVKPTIVSRCQKHEFRKIYWSKIGDQLVKIAKQEKINVDPAALNLCAKMADGSMRAALQHLEKLGSFVDHSNQISLDDAQKMFGSADYNLYFDLIDEVIGKDTGVADSTNGFRIITNILANGTDFAQIYSNVADHLRNIMVVLTSSKPLEFIQLTEEGKHRLKEQVKQVKERSNIEAILECMTKLNDARLSVDYNFPPETALQHWFLESVFAIRRPR